MSELRDRLERLATRGSPRGADDVLKAAQRGLPMNEVDIVPDDNSHDLPIIADSVPMVSVDVEPRSRMRTLVAVFGIAALVGVGGLAVASIFGNGGADSPKGAVQQLADAISHKDPLAAIDVLSPTEVRSMRDTVNGATRHAADLKIVNDASAPLAGVDLSVDNLQLSTEPLADGYTKVIVNGGELSASAHTAELSQLLQDATRNADPSDTKTKVDLAKLARAEDLPTFVVTVRHDGRWYVSPAYTALEYAREIGDGPQAEFGSAQAATDLGSATPEQAVSDAFRAWQAGDWNRLMALAPPDELPVYDYRAWLAQVGAESPPDFTIDKLTTSASAVNGDTATVKLDASGTMGRGDDRGAWQVGGTCPDFSDPQWSDSSSAQELFTGQGGRPTNGVELCLSGDLGNVVPFGLIAAGTDVSEPSSAGSVSVEVVRENGRWFVSPVSTVLKALDATVQHFDERSIYTLLNLSYKLPPDGTITLDQPFTPPAGRGVYAESVFAFDGTKGQQVVGELSADGGYASGEIFTAAGKEVDYVEFAPRKGGISFPAQLPETGSYRLVLSGVVRKGTTLTLWDVKHAPKGLISNPDYGTSCTIGVGGGTTCSGSGSASSSGDGGPMTAAPTPTTGPVTAPSLGIVKPPAGSDAAVGYAPIPQAVTATTGAATSTP